MNKKDPYIDLWNKICSILQSQLPEWKKKIADGGQVSAVEARERGEEFSDKQIFHGIVKAVLSNSTDWSRIEKVLPELNDLFHGFDLEYYSGLSANDIERDFLHWFSDRGAGSLTMKQNLKSLVRTAQILKDCSQRVGSLNRYLTSLRELNKNDTIALVQQLGSNKSLHKLPALGIPIAAEAMKNVGFDVAKPDRHINRAMGSFRLVHFSKWPDRSKCKAPQITETEMIDVMRSMDRFAKHVGVRVSFMDNAIWLLCCSCKSGLYLSNAQLSGLV
jgi:3-methyladenine DNA glycosylase Tag